MDNRIQKIISDVAKNMHLPCNLQKLPRQSSPRSQKYTDGVVSQLQAILKVANEARDLCAVKAHLNDDQEVVGDVWDPVHERQARAWAEGALSRVRDLILQEKTLRDASSLPVKPTKAVFNYEYTPLLEQYFKYNAYPSAADRTVLARISMMAPRQIEVWFQNHRNRAKKEGKILPRLTNSTLPSELSSKSLEPRLSLSTIPLNQRKPMKKRENLEYVGRETVTTPALGHAESNVQTLNPLRPSYAFPTKYVPPVGRIFSSNVTTHTLPAPVWHRKPADHSRHRKSRIDMDEFIMNFGQKLHLRVSASDQQQSQACQSWCAGRVTIPESAPLPSLVRSVTRTLTRSWHLELSHTPGHLQSSEETTPSKKIFCLAERVPQNTSPYSNLPMTRNPMALPSMSSSSSPISHRRLSTSSDSSSSSSVSSSIPTTPVQSPTLFSNNDVIVSGIDCDGIDDVRVSEFLSAYGETTVTGRVHHSTKVTP